MQRPTAQVIPSYPKYSLANLYQQFLFVETLPDLNQLTNDPIPYVTW